MAKQTSPREATEHALEKLRVDKWLWAARFYRTRSIAAAAVDAGQVRVNGERAKPGRAVHSGERIQVNKGGLVWDVEIVAIAERRGPAGEAAKLYGESESSRLAREEEVARRRAAAASEPQFAGRPTKRERRKLEDFLNEP